MKLGGMRLCVLAIATTVVIITVKISAQASEVGPISKRTPVLMTQGSVAPQRPQLAEPISESARVLVGHWRKTTIVFEQPEDEHLVLYTNGTAENWVVTASSRSMTTTGTWNVEGKMLNLLLEGHGHISQPFYNLRGTARVSKHPKPAPLLGKSCQVRWETRNVACYTTWLDLTTKS